MTRATDHVRALLALVVAAALAATGATLLGAHTSRADASCAAPITYVPKGVRVRSGAVVTVKGKFFLADCYDTGQQGTPPPMKHVVLKLRQHGHVWRLGVADAKADPLGTISWRVHIPRGVRPGTARFVTGEFTSDVHVYRARHRAAPAATPSGLPDTGA